MSKVTVTYSELRERRRCPYRAHLNYDRLLSPRVTTPGLREGTIMDAGMNALYEGVKRGFGHNEGQMLRAMQAAFDAECERIKRLATLMDEEWQKIDDSFALLRDVALAYIGFAREADKGWEPVCTQFSGRVPVLTPDGHASTKYDYQFKADGLVAVDGRLWLLENKAWATIASDAVRMLALDEQCGMYLWGIDQLVRRGEAPEVLNAAVKQYGEPVGVLYNIVRKAIPRVPPTLKNGSTSQDKRIDTTYDLYLATLQERGQNPDDYWEVLDALKEKGDTFHYREQVQRNRPELTEIGTRIYEATRFLSAGHHFKFPERSCTWECRYLPLCLEWSEEVMQAGYVVREKRHAEYSEEEEAA